MSLKEYIYYDLARKREPCLKNFLLEYFDITGDKCFKFEVWLRLTIYLKKNRFLKYTIGIPVYMYFHYLELRMGIFVNTNINIGRGLSIIHPGGYL